MKIKLPAPRFSFNSATARIRRFALGGMLVASAALLSPASAETGTADSNEKEVVLAVLRAPAPKVLSEKILGVARKIVPGPQTEALPFMLGGMLGDPMLDGFSPTENLGVVLFENEDDLLPVLVLKLTDESPLRQTLPHFNLHLQEFDGWTFGLQEEDAKRLIEGRESELISKVREERLFDLELSIASSELAKKLRDFSGDLPQLGGIEDKMLRPLIAGVAAETDSVSDFRVGIDLSPEAIRQALYLQATPGSELAAFLDQKRPENYDFAKFIPASDPVLFLAGSDIEATRRYFNHFFKSFLDQATGEDQKILQEIDALTKRYFDQTDGRSGGTFALQENMIMEMTQVSSSTLSNSELIEFLKEGLSLSNKLLEHEIWKSLGIDGESEKEELLLNQSEINGIPIHTVRADYPAFDQSEEEATVEMKTQEIHYALIDGYLINTSSLPRMAGLIEAIQKGEPVENNLGSAIDLGENKLAAWRVDLIGYIGEVLLELPASSHQVIKQLQEKNLPPISGWATAQNGRGRVETTIPVDTVAAIYQAFMQQMEAQFEQHPVPIQE